MFKYAVFCLFTSIAVADPRSRRSNDSDEPDLYEVLGLTRGCTLEDIRKSFKKMSRLHHPDLAPESKKDEAVDKFKWIKKAHEILKDPQQRREYDATGIADIQYHRENEIYRRKARMTYFDEATSPIIEIDGPSELTELVNSNTPTVVLFWDAQLELKAAADTFKSFALLYQGIVRTAHFSCESYPSTCRKIGLYSNGLPAFAVASPRAAGALIARRNTTVEPSYATFAWLNADTAPLWMPPHGAPPQTLCAASTDGGTAVLGIVDRDSDPTCDVIIPPYGAEYATRTVRMTDDNGVVGRARRWLAADAARVPPSSPSAPPMSAYAYVDISSADVAMTATRSELAAWAIPHLSAVPRPGTDPSERASCPPDGAPAVLIARTSPTAPPLARFVEGAALRMMFQGLVLRGALQFVTVDCPAVLGGYAAVRGGADELARARAVCSGFAAEERPEREDWDDARVWVRGYAAALCGLGPAPGTPSARRAAEAVGAGMAPADVAADAFDLVHTVPVAAKSALGVAKLFVSALHHARVATFPSHLVAQHITSADDFDGDVLDGDDAWLVSFSGGDWCSWCVWAREELKLMPLALPDLADAKAFEMDNVRVAVVTCMPNAGGHGMSRQQMRVHELCKQAGVSSYPKVAIYPAGTRAQKQSKAWHTAKRHAVYMADTTSASAAPVDVDVITSMAALRNLMAAVPVVPPGAPPATAHVVLFTAGSWCGPCTQVSGWWPVGARKLADAFPGSGIRAATVNCDAARDVCNAVGVQAYPTIYLRITGDSTWHKLSGERSPEGVVKGVRSALFSPVLHVADHDQLKSRIVGNLAHPAVVLFAAGDWCPPCGVAKGAYGDIAVEAALRIDFRDGAPKPPRDNVKALRRYLDTRLPFLQVNCDELKYSCKSVHGPRPPPRVVARARSSASRPLPHRPRGATAALSSSMPTPISSCAARARRCGRCTTTPALGGSRPRSSSGSRRTSSCLSCRSRAAYGHALYRIDPPFCPLCV